MDGRNLHASSGVVLRGMEVVWCGVWCGAVRRVCTATGERVYGLAEWVRRTSNWADARLCVAHSTKTNTGPRSGIYPFLTLKTVTWGRVIVLKKRNEPSMQ